MFIFVYFGSDVVNAGFEHVLFRRSYHVRDDWLGTLILVPAQNNARHCLGDIVEILLSVVKNHRIQRTTLAVSQKQLFITHTSLEWRNPQK